MGKFNTELVNAGIMLAGEGLQPEHKGVRITYEGGGKASVTDGPFAETKELVAGFWILQVKSRDEAVEWMRRAPFEPGGDPGDPPGVRGRGLRRGVHPRGAGGRGGAAREDRGAVAR